MANNHSFLLITDDENKLSDIVEQCSDEKVISHIRFLDRAGSLYGVSGEISTLPKECLTTVLQRARLMSDPNTRMLYILNNQTYVCELLEKETDTAITIYNHSRNIAYTNEGEELPSEAKELIYKWLHQ